MDKVPFGPDYTARLELRRERERWTLRKIPSSLAYLCAWIFSAIASLPLTGLLLERGLLRQVSDGSSILAMTACILGTTVGGTLLYALLAWGMRPRITMDWGRDCVTKGRRKVGRVSDVISVEKTAYAMAWQRLAIVFRNGRKLVFLTSPFKHTSADTLGESVAGFLRVPLRDYSEGDYKALLGLVIQGERLTLSPPNQALARTLEYLTWGGLFLAFCLLVLPQAGKHELSGRGIGLIIGGAGMGVYSLAIRLFHRRIVLDRMRSRLLVGRRTVCGLTEVAHVGLNIGREGNHRMAFVLRDGRQILIVNYPWYPPTTVETARTLANFLNVRVEDYYYDAVHAEEREKERALREGKKYTADR